MFKKLWIILTVIFSMTLLGCTSGVDNISFRDIINKELIDDVKQGTEEFVKNYNFVDINGVKFINDKITIGEYLRVNLSLEDKEAIKNIEKISEIYINNIVDILEEKEEKVEHIAIVWNCNDGEKTMSYIYRIDINNKIVLEESYIDEKKI